MIDPETIPDSALQRLGGALTDLLDDDHWNNVEKNYLLPALEERQELLNERDNLLLEVKNLLRSASPHPVDNPTMHKAWVRATNLVSEFEPIAPNYLK